MRYAISVWILLLCAASVLADEVPAITAALRARRFQEALELSHTALEKSPKDVRVLVLEGMALSGLSKDQEALAAYRNAIKLAPDYLPAVEAAAEIEYRKGMPEAPARLERVLALHPGEPTAHAMLGALAWKKSDCAAAVEHFGQAKAAIASQPDALREFGACLLKLKRPEDAAGVFRQLAELRPDDRRARYALAVAWMEAGRFGDAVDALRPLTESSSPDPVALQLTSAAYEQSGDTPKAVAALRQAIVLDPRNVDLYLDFADIAFIHQSFQVGVDMINAGLTQVPNSAPMYLARGIMYVQLGDYAKADVDFDKAERLDPNRAFAQVARGLSEVQQNNFDQALATVRSQLKTNPKDPFLHYMLSEMLSRQGTLKPSDPEFKQALDAAREAVRLKPDFVLARDVLSKLYLWAGEHDKAIEQCRLALRDNPADETAIYRLIRALKSSGKPEAEKEIPALLAQFTKARDEARKREARENQFRLVEGK